MYEFPELQKKSGSALVLSGGATKAFYFHLGVLKVLQPEDISAIVGSSAGAVVGGFIASGATVDNLIMALYQKQVYLPKFDRWVKTLSSTMLFRPKYRGIGWQSLHTGLAGLHFLAGLPRLNNHDVVAEALDMLVHSQTKVSGFLDSSALENLFRTLLPSRDFNNTEIDLYVVATCLDNGHRAIFNGLYEFEKDDDTFMTDVPIHRAVRASASVPGMFEPVKIKGKHYIDGEVKRTLSADIGVSVSDKVIISHTYQPLQLNGHGSVSEMGWVNVLKQSLSIVLYERIARWRQIYEERYPGKEIIWIHPDPEDIDFFLAPEFSFRPEVQKKMIKCGEIAALKALSGSS